MLTKEEKDALARAYNVHGVIVVNDTVFIVLRMLYDYALLVNPTLTGYEERFCYRDLKLIDKALREYKERAELRYWHKNHSKELTVACGNLLFKSGAKQCAGEECGTVDWIVEH